MTYLIDTDWTADYLGNRRGAVTLLSSLADQGLAISIISYGEIYEGILFGGKRQEQDAGFGLFLRGVEVLPLSRPIMRRFAELRGTLRRQGQLIGDPDIMIAATALHHGLTLVTRNVRHFRRMPDLLIYEGHPSN